MDVVNIYTDGSADNLKSREGGCGVVLRFRDMEKDVFFGRYINTTSARMEILAVIKALEICEPGFDIVIHSDNQYVVNAANDWAWKWEKTNFAGKKNEDLWKRFIELMTLKHDRDSVSFKWVKGHDGTELNELADQLANKGRLFKSSFQDTDINH